MAGSIREAAEESVAAAREAGRLSDLDNAAVAALLYVAESIDLLEDGINPAGKFDNVSITAFLKYCNDLGLTPAARAVKEQKAKASDEKEGRSGKLAQLRSIGGPA